jgi:hypothetical protein
LAANNPPNARAPKFKSKNINNRKTIDQI